MCPLLGLGAGLAGTISKPWLLAGLLLRVYGQPTARLAMAGAQQGLTPLVLERTSKLSLKQAN